ncbi:FAD-dependent monooxygenase [Streptomyces sp. NPDC017943]|uniref:FAD-dependent monooxygenase n=1 Tax=Streptomyces sp. NPDC017943 TaxID=3365019 RepID=UPI003790340C
MADCIQAQVVIAGGGPVGMVLACELAGYGVSTVVVEAGTAVSGRPRATTLHARTVQCLVRRGYLEGLSHSDDGAEPATSAFHFAGMAGLGISAPAAEPEPVLKRTQQELEHHFEERARAAGALILRGHRVTGLRQGPDGVRVTADGPDGAVTCTAEYLVGADGARSVVREQAGFACRTYPATVSALAGDVLLEEPGQLEEGWRRTRRGWIVAKHLPDGGTRLRTLDCAGAHDERHRPPTLQELRGEVSRIVARDVPMRAPKWLSRFSDFARLSRSYRKGRILLAGDAAHVHFPIGGQGLSTGLLDAVDLGWKLALTVRGKAGEGLLDSYDRERRPAAQRVIDHTRAQLALMRPAAELDPLRALFGELLGGQGAGGALASMVSAQDTVLPARARDASPWEGRFLHNVGLTTRQGRTDVIDLLIAGRPLLLLLGAAGDTYAGQARGWAGMLRVVHAEPAPGLPCEALLVRPDGYIAWAAGGGALRSALTAYFGIATGTAGRAAGTGALAPALG